MENIYGVLKIGPLVANNQEFSLLITVDNLYYTVWEKMGPDTYIIIEQLTTKHRVDPNEDDLWSITEEAKTILQEYINKSFDTYN